MNYDDIMSYSYLLRCSNCREIAEFLGMTPAEAKMLLYIVIFGIIFGYSIVLFVVYPLWMRFKQKNDLFPNTSSNFF